MPNANGPGPRRPDRASRRAPASETSRSRTRRRWRLRATCLPTLAVGSLIGRLGGDCSSRVRRRRVCTRVCTWPRYLTTKAALAGGPRGLGRPSGGALSGLTFRSASKAGARSVPGRRLRGRVVSTGRVAIPPEGCAPTRPPIVPLATRPLAGWAGLRRGRCPADSHAPSVRRSHAGAPSARRGLLSAPGPCGRAPGGRASAARPRGSRGRSRGRSGALRASSNGHAGGAARG